MCIRDRFGNVVHTFTANLDFDPLPVIAHEGDVQGLIAVGFRMAHPVSYTHLYRPIKPFNRIFCSTGEKCYIFIYKDKEFEQAKNMDAACEHIDERLTPYYPTFIREVSKEDIRCV